MTKQETDERWRKRAEEYRRSLEDQQHLLVVTPTVIRRMAIVRFRRHYNLKEIGETHCKVGELRKRIDSNRRSHLVQIVKVWVVEGPSDSDHSKTTEHSRWNNLHMAKAHRDGREFHYAKHLMTEDTNRWTSDLSGGVSSRRR